MKIRYLPGQAHYFSERNNRENSRVALLGNELFLRNLSTPPDVGHFMRALNRLIGERHKKEITVYLEGDFSIYANIIVPVASILNKLKRQGYVINIIDKTTNIAEIQFTNPVNVSDVNIENFPNLFQRIWRFSNGKEIQRFIDSTIHAIGQSVLCEQGFLAALALSMCEIMDNVLQHSEESEGFVMIQLHREARKIAFAVADSGIGIYKSLASSSHRPKTHADALRLAIKQGVTRDERIGRGNGLWILSETVKHNGGQYTLQSGEAALHLSSNNLASERVLEVPSFEKKGGCTFIDFQLSAAQRIVLKDILKDQILVDVDLRLESFEDEFGNHVIKVRELELGTATRESGEAARILARNLLNEGVPHVTFDFGGIRIISASFADELFGEFYRALGAAEIKNQIRVLHANTDVSYMIERAMLAKIAAN